jgi:hypothetical protein
MAVKRNKKRMQDAGCWVLGTENHPGTYILNPQIKNPEAFFGLRVGVFRVKSNPLLRPPGRNNNTDAADDADIDDRHVGQAGKHGKRPGCLENGLFNQLRKDSGHRPRRQVEEVTVGRRNDAILA